MSDDRPTKTALLWVPEEKQTRGRPTITWKTPCREVYDTCDLSWEEILDKAVDRGERLNGAAGLSVLYVLSTEWTEV